MGYTRHTIGVPFVVLGGEVRRVRQGRQGLASIYFVRLKNVANFVMLIILI